MRSLTLIVLLSLLYSCTTQVVDNPGYYTITIVSKPSYNLYVDSIPGTDYKIVYSLVNNTSDKSIDFIDTCHNKIYESIWINDFMFKPYTYKYTELYVEWMSDYTPNYVEWYDVWDSDFNVYFHNPDLPLYVIFSNILFVP